jgi:hypothetical protein
MSNYGIDAENASGELTFSDNGFIYGYIGRASVQSVNQPGTDITGSQAGYSVYTINWPGDIVVALPIKDNGPTFVYSMRQSESVWTIFVYKGSDALNSLKFDVQEATDVYVFGAPVTSTGYGITLYDNNGNITGDLSRRPLMYSAYVSMDATTFTAAIPPLSIPAVIGCTCGRTTQSVRGSNGRWTNRITGLGWKRDSINQTIYRSFTQEAYSQDDGGIAVSSVRYPTSCVLIEAAGLA